jgi:hypothetical protein
MVVSFLGIILSQDIITLKNQEHLEHLHFPEHKDFIKAKRATWHITKRTLQ